MTPPDMTAKPRYGFYGYGFQPDLRVSDDEAKAQAEVDRRNELGECVCFMDFDPEPFHCRRCGREHRNPTSDYCTPCNNGL